MVTIHFYSKLITTDSLVEALNELDLTDEQRARLLGIVESSLHHAIVDAILSELSNEDKQTFLQYLTEDDHRKIWDFLNKKVERIEERITETADGLKKELHQDIIETKGN